MGGMLIFDGECGFCTRTRDVLAGLDRHHRVSTMPFQSRGVAEAAGVSREELATAVYWLGDDGSRCSGAHAVNAALACALGTRLPLWIYRLPGVRQLQDAAYRWMAANRYRLRGTTPWCASHPSTCR